MSDEIVGLLLMLPMLLIIAGGSVFMIWCFYAEMGWRARVVTVLLVIAVVSSSIGQTMIERSMKNRQQAAPKMPYAED